jgi:hypothetical protein
LFPTGKFSLVETALPEWKLMDLSPDESWVCMRVSQLSYSGQTRTRVAWELTEYYRARSENPDQVSAKFEPAQSQWELMRVDESHQLSFDQAFTARNGCKRNLEVVKSPFLTKKHFFDREDVRILHLYYFCFG